MQITMNRHCNAIVRTFRSLTLLALGLNLIAYSGLANALQSEQASEPSGDRFATNSLMLDITQAGKRLIAVGERGFIITSENDGRTWERVSSPVSQTLTRVQFVDSKYGWAVGHEGVVLHTTDGGSTWLQQLDGERAAQIELAAALKAQDRATNESGDRRVGLAERLVAEGADKPFLAIHFFDRKSGLVLGAYGLAFATEDGGKSWHSIIGRLENPRGLHLYDFEEVGGTYFIAGEQGLLLRSNERDRQFRMLDTPATGTLFGLLHASSRSVLAYGLKGRMFISEDKGNTWKLVPNEEDATVTNGKRLQDGTLLLVDEAGRLLVSRDGGHHFEASPVPNAGYLTGLTRTNEGNFVLSSVKGVFRLPSDHQVVEN